MNASDAPRPPPYDLRASWRHWLTGTAPQAGPAWLQSVWTALFAATIAVFFTLASFVAKARSLADWLDPGAWRHVYAGNLVVALVISFMIRGLFALVVRVVGRPRIRALPERQRTAVFVAIPLLGTLLGWPLGIALVIGDLRKLSRLNGGDVVSLVVVGAMIFGGFYLYFSLRNREIRAEMRASEAQLRLLQGQMEPHFLFNTLANVISLIDADAPRAKHLLEALTDYLRASLGSLRHGETTLGAEIELAQRYLELMQVRMGERLRFEIDVAPSLRAATLSPLLLQPLVENAVKHGLEARLEGGTVRVHAAAIEFGGAAALRVCVDDDGVGLRAAATAARRTVGAGPDGHGIALANVRERLRALYAGTAQLTLAELAPPGSTRACLVLPWRVASDAARAPAAART